MPQNKNAAKSPNSKDLQWIPVLRASGNAVVESRAAMVVTSAAFPLEVEDRGIRYFRTGKVGTERATGEATAEYSHLDMGGESRVWATVDGRITERC